MRRRCAFIDSPNFLADYLDNSLRLCMILNLAAGFELNEVLI